MHKHINERRADVFSFPFGLECYVLRVMKTKHKTERHSRPEGIPSLWKRINFLACTLSYNLLLAGRCRLKYKYRLRFRLGVYPDFISGLQVRHKAIAQTLTGLFASIRQHLSRGVLLAKRDKSCCFLSLTIFEQIQVSYTHKPTCVMEHPLCDLRQDQGA